MTNRFYKIRFEKPKFFIKNGKFVYYIQIVKKKIKKIVINKISLCKIMQIYYYPKYQLILILINKLKIA